MGKEQTKSGNITQAREAVDSIPDFTGTILQTMSEPSKIRDGVRITDIIMCDRQKLFQIINPKKPLAQNIIRSATGTALHNYAQKKILKNPDPEIYEVEVPVDYKGVIFGSIDLFHKKAEIVIDIKVKIVNGATSDVRPFFSHIQQLKNLMAMKGVAKGALVYVLVGGSTPILQSNYTMTEEERHLQLGKLEERASSFLNARNNKDPSLAQHVFFNKDLRWLCHRTDKQTGQDIWCPYYWDCMSIISNQNINPEVCDDYSQGGVL
jgi:hypothetical protein